MAASTVFNFSKSLLRCISIIYTVIRVKALISLNVNNIGSNLAPSREFEWYVHISIVGLPTHLSRTLFCGKLLPQCLSLFKQQENVLTLLCDMLVERFVVRLIWRVGGQRGSVV